MSQFDLLINREDSAQDIQEEITINCISFEIDV
jgi:hypothetical protein